MTYIFIDESGDLGMGVKGSAYFILTATKISDDGVVGNFKRIPKQIRQRTLHKQIKKQTELKFSNSSTVIREQFLRRATRLDIGIYSLIIKKELTQQKLRENLPILYNYLIKVLLEKALMDLNKSRLTICLDRCMSSLQRENFEMYIKTEFLYLFSHLPDVVIRHESSQENPSLQVADFICGAFGYKYNTMRLLEGCNEFTSILKERIKVEKTDLFKEKTNPAYWS